MLVVVLAVLEQRLPEDAFADRLELVVYRRVHVARISRRRASGVRIAVDAPPLRGVARCEIVLIQSNNLPR